MWDPPPVFIAPALHDGGRCNDRNLLERIEREEIGITGDDQIGMPVDGQLRKLVVLWITTSRDSLGDRDQPGRRRQFAHPISKPRRDQRGKARAPRVTNSSRSVTVDLRRSPLSAAIRTAIPGGDFSYCRADKDICVDDSHPSSGCASSRGSLISRSISSSVSPAATTRALRAGRGPTRQAQS
jgi:hypothetical protein